ncbi:Cadherin 19, type 2 [Apodemus speciosus]|uniref:Cadherin 19, type 2 n=1 Tax=Apodemus speciosus TaxID=105296 RepID=A0ABQ0EEU7_APOSI
MNQCFLKHWILMIPLLWPCLKVAETLEAEKTQRAVPSPGRAKRGWVWNQFVVPEEMDTILHVGRLRSDLDNGNNSFQYKLLGNDAGSFSIDERTGDIFAIQKLDREEQSLYILRAQVIDTTIGKAVEPESEFVIRVSDINDNEPRFLDEPYEAIVPEMSPEGVIRISSKMDRELQDTYCVIIQAKDMLGQPGALSGTTTVSIKLSDINDNKPIFKEKYTMNKGFYRFTISESAPSGTSIGKIMAYDDDIGENAEMEYSLEDDDSKTFDIIIDSETQEGIVILKKQVDFEHQSHYGIRAKVKNSHVDEELAPAHVNASTTYIKVQVEDEDEPPVFLLPHYIFEIPEGKPYGTMVGTVSAIDPDRRQSPMIYSLTGSKMFDINNNGTIITTNTLDRENNVQQISSAHVYVQVFNINDNAPEFSQFYETYVCENAESGEIIQTISAIDRDESIEDHHFYFNHSVEDTNNSSFMLTDNQDNTAVILSNRTGFSLKDEPVFYMIILIADNGIPSLTSTNTLTIQVCDCGDSRNTDTCANKGLLFILGFKTEAIIAILICVMVIFGFLCTALAVLELALRLIFLTLALKERRKEILFPEKTEDFRENIFCYDDEGGGEEDSEAFDIVELRQSTVMRERKLQRSKSAEIRSLYRQSLQVGPDSAIFRKFIQEKLEEANTDPCAPPFDSLQTFAYEGTGSSAGSLSSLESRAPDQEDDFDYLDDLGPRFKRLACMFGSAVQPNN